MSFSPPVHFTRKTKYAGFNYVIGVTEAAAGTKVLQGQLWFVTVSSSPWVKVL